MAIQLNPGDQFRDLEKYDLSILEYFEQNAGVHHLVGMNTLSKKISGPFKLEKCVLLQVYQDTF